MKQVINSTEVDKYLKGLMYPANKEEIINHAREQEAPNSVVDILNHLPEQEYQSVTDVTHALERGVDW